MHKGSKQQPPDLMGSSEMLVNSLKNLKTQWEKLIEMSNMVRDTHLEKLSVSTNYALGRRVGEGPDSHS